MNNCEAYWQLISDSLDGALTPEEQARLDEHLAQCPECREMYQQMQRMSLDICGDMVQAPAGFADAVMAQAAETEQDIPFTNLPQNRDLHKAGRERMKAWWKPIKNWCAIAACCLIVLGLGTMAARSGLVAGGGSSGAAENSAPTAASDAAEQAVMESQNDSAAEDRWALDDEGVSAESSSLESEAPDSEIIIWLDGAAYCDTADIAAELPEGFQLAGLLDRADFLDGCEYYTGDGGDIYVFYDGAYHRWEKE